MRYLSGSLDDFLKRDEKYFNSLPFGTGPWLCFNPICSFNERVITNCKRKDHEWVTGYFTCSHCGMIYTRKGLPKEEDETQYSIETMGFLFINSAIKYYQQGYLITQIAELLKSNKTTVSKYLRVSKQLRPYRSHQPQNSIAVDAEASNYDFTLSWREIAVASNGSKLDLCKETVLEAIHVLGEASNQKINKKVQYTPI